MSIDKRPHDTISVLSSHGYIPSSGPYERIRALADRAFPWGWKFGQDTDSAIYVKESHKAYIAIITEDYLLHGSKKGTCSKAGYVSTVQQIKHEERHMQQKVIEWNKTGIRDSMRSTKRMTDIIRRELIKEHFGPAYINNYGSDPAEIDAAVYGIQETLEYFKSDPYVSYDEAKQILFELMTADTYSHAKELNEYPINSMNNLMEAFIDLRDKAVHKPYSLEYDKTSPLNGRYANVRDLTNTVLTNPEYAGIKSEYEKCGDGRMMDKLLEQVIVRKYPKISEKVPRLQEELDECKRKMRHGILKVRMDDIPVEQIDYAKRPEDLVAENMPNNPDKEFTDAVNRIPGPDDNQSITR